MQITRELLMNERAAIAEKMAVMSGALQTIDQLIALHDRPEPDAMTLDEVAEMVGGHGATAEMVKAVENGTTDKAR